MAEEERTERRGGHDAERRRGSLRAIAADMPRIAAPALGRRGFGEAQLMAQWAAIIGEELADKVMPERLRFARGERRDGTLRLRVAPALALEIQHREPQLLERINGFFGYRAVARLVLVQGLPPPRKAAAAPHARPLSGAEREALDRRLAGIADPELRAALKSLGESVIASTKP